MSPNKNENPARTKKSNPNLKMITIVILFVIAAVVIIFTITKLTTKKNTSKTKESSKQTEIIEKVDFKKEGELTFNSSSLKYISTIDIEIAEDDGVIITKRSTSFKSNFTNST